MKDKIVAALLAFFLGVFGVHQFYLGNTSKGILYLIFCWTFIPAIIAFVDFIMLLVRDQEDFDRQYNHGRSSHRVSVASVASELEKLHELKEKGILSEEEFIDKKREILR